MREIPESIQEKLGIPEGETPIWRFNISSGEDTLKLSTTGSGIVKPGVIEYRMSSIILPELSGTKIARCEATDAFFIPHISDKLDITVSLTFDGIEETVQMFTGKGEVVFYDRYVFELSARASIPELEALFPSEKPDGVLFPNSEGDVIPVVFGGYHDTVSEARECNRGYARNLIPAVLLDASNARYGAKGHIEETDSLWLKMRGEAFRFEDVERFNEEDICGFRIKKGKLVFGIHPTNPDWVSIQGEDIKNGSTDWYKLVEGYDGSAKLDQDNPLIVGFRETPAREYDAKPSQIRFKVEQLSLPEGATLTAYIFRFHDTILSQLDIESTGEYELEFPPSVELAREVQLAFIISSDEPADAVISRVFTEGYDDSFGSFEKGEGEVTPTVSPAPMRKTGKLFINCNGVIHTAGEPYADYREVIRYLLHAAGLTDDRIDQQSLNNLTSDRPLPDFGVRRVLIKPEHISKTVSSLLEETGIRLLMRGDGKISAFPRPKTGTELKSFYDTPPAGDNSIILKDTVKVEIEPAVYTRLVILYDYDYFSEGFRGRKTVVIPGAEEIIEKELSLRWLIDPEPASGIAEKLYGSPQTYITFATNLQGVVCYPGDLIKVVHPTIGDACFQIDQIKYSLTEVTIRARKQEGI